MIIFLNGTSASGKTSIAKELQNHYPGPLMLTGIDEFFKMMPSKYIGMNDGSKPGFYFEEDVDNDGPIVYMHAGEYARKLYSAGPYGVRMLADAGNDVIIDEVLVGGRKELDWYRHALRGHKGYFISVNCSLEEVQRREKGRLNRFENHARPQFKIVHNHGLPYDFEVNTTNISIEKAAKQVLDFVLSGAEPKVFKGESETFVPAFKINFNEGRVPLKGHPEEETPVLL
ncbi:AAA family ATPase [bacterium]|nr:AAA family ATPase [bacterium]